MGLTDASVAFIPSSIIARGTFDGPSPALPKLPLLPDPPWPVESFCGPGGSIVVAFTALVVGLPPAGCGFPGSGIACLSTTGSTEGHISVLGLSATDPEHFFTKVGYCTQFDSHPKGFTGYQFVYSFLRLFGWDHRKSEEAAWRVIERVGLVEAANRQVAGYSKGMRQRIRLAQSICHDPQVLVLDELGAIRCPTLVITGEDDTAQPARNSEQIAAGIRGAKLVRIPACGHSSSLEQPEAVTAAMREIMKG